VCRYVKLYLFLTTRGKQRTSRLQDFKRLHETATARTSDFSKTSKDFERLRKTSKDFRRLQKTSNDFKRLQTPSKDCMRLQETSKDFWDFIRLQEIS
jgi:hypothetical protein